MRTNAWQRSAKWLPEIVHSLVADPVAAALVLDALDPAHPHAVPCRLVLPFVGA